MKRIFLAIGLPPQTQQKIGEALSWMRAFEAHVRIVPPENFHVTLKFLGPVPEERIGEIAGALQRAMNRESFRGKPLELLAGAWGTFPDPGNPSIFWIGVKPLEALLPLAEFFEDIFETLGFPKESRPYTPHVTAARVNQNPPLEFLRQWNQMPPVSLPAFRADHLTLYANIPSRPSLSEYRKLRDFPLPDSHGVFEKRGINS